MTRSLPRKSASVRGCPVWSTSANGPPTGSRFHIKGVVARVAAEPVLLRELDDCVRQDALDARALDLARCEGVARDDRRGLAEHGRDLLRRKFAPVEHAEIGELARCAPALIAMAEIVLAAGVELDVGRERRAVFLEEADEPAKMVVMAVANDERVELARVNAGDVDVVEERLGAVAEVEHHGALLCALSVSRKSDRPHWLWRIC